MPLMKLEPREKGVIVKVTEEKLEVPTLLETLGLIPGSTVCARAQCDEIKSRLRLQNCINNMG